MSDKNGVQIVLVEFLDPRIQVAAQVEDFKIRPKTQQLRLSAEAAGAYAGAFRQPFQGSVGRANQHVMGIFAFWGGADDQPLLYLRWHVFGAVYGDVYLAVN